MIAARTLRALALLLVGACAPRIAAMGPPEAAPGLLDDRIVQPDGAVLPLKRWLPAGEPKAVILALHGFNDYSNAFAAPAESWAKSGIATYAYDQRGFGAATNRGLWPGTETLVEDADTAARLVAARHPGVPLFVMGESMGGAVILAAVADGRLSGADGVILSAPAVRGGETIGPISRGALWLAAHLVPWLAERPPSNLGYHPSDNIPMLRALGADPLVIKETRVDAFYGLINLMDDALAAAPLFDRAALILIGAQDNLIPGKATDLMLARLPRAGAAERRVAVYEKGYHMLLRDLQGPVVHQDVAHWVLTRQTDPLAALPSGADRQGRAELADVPPQP